MDKTCTYADLIKIDNGKREVGKTNVKKKWGHCKSLRGKRKIPNRAEKHKCGKSHVDNPVGLS